MKRIYKTILLVLPLLISGCALFTGGIKEDSSLIDVKALQGKNIAVVSFEKEGPDLPNKIEKTVADKLSHALFVSGKVNIIDRSIVNNAQAEIKLFSTSRASAETLKQMGKSVGADYLILGKIINSPRYMNYLEVPKGIITLSIRIVSSESAKIAGMSSFTAEYDDDFQVKLESVISKLANSICN